MVQTGASRRRYYGKRRTSVSSSTSEGLRTLCATCAKQYDEEAASKHRQAVFRARAKFALLCGAAALVATALVSQPPKSHEPISSSQQETTKTPSGQEATTPPNREDSDAPSETGVIGPSPTPVHEETVARVAPATPFPSIGGDPVLMDPNVPADAETIQDRLRSLGFSVTDPRGVWSKGTDLALRMFRRSHGLRTDWRWDLSTQAALFGERK
jgi:hypothetical protein